MAKASCRWTSSARNSASFKGPPAPRGLRKWPTRGPPGQARGAVFVPLRDSDKQLRNRSFNGSRIERIAALPPPV